MREPASDVTDQAQVSAEHFLTGIRVLEVADELGEYCGKVLAGLGADVVKVEPPGGEVTRRYGPFFGAGTDPDRSLYFWHFNFGKRAVTVDLDTESGREDFRRLAATADVLVDTRPRGYLAGRGLDRAALAAGNPGLVTVRITPFGDDGPWAGYQGSDLVHLALGGVVMNCGYDPDPAGYYETPPVAPQMWQSYQIAGEAAVMAVLGALLWRAGTGSGQEISVAVHDAVAKQTETDLPDWIYSRLPHARATCRHSRPDHTATRITPSKDGRWILPYRRYLGSATGQVRAAIRIMDSYGMAEDLTGSRYDDDAVLSDPVVLRHVDDVVERFIARFMYDREIWRDFQDEGMPWAPLRLPEENLGDPHLAARDTFTDVQHPELQRTFREIGARWVCDQVGWRTGPRAPLLGEHNALLRQDTGPGSRTRTRTGPGPASTEGSRPAVRSALGKPFAIQGARIVDMGWLLASGGAGRFLAAQGAEVIKIEHQSAWDQMRWSNGMVPPGGRAERDAATEPFTQLRTPDPNRSGFFMEIHAGKRHASLNVKDPRGRDLLRQLIRSANAVIEGFSPGTMERLGLGYGDLRQLNPAIVYAQQSGMGQRGVYGRMRTYGPVAQAFSGMSEMSGLPEPYPPAGIGYSYLDWFGAYNLATALLAALYRQRMTGKGCWIDSSQVEMGVYLTGTAVLDYQANGRHWHRYGNRSPYKPGAPHGIYRTAGQNRWIAVSCFTDSHWRAVTATLGLTDAAADPRFDTLEARLGHQDSLDKIVEDATSQREGYELMHALQSAGVPAGVCQTAEDRYERDAQLAHLQWLRELPQSDIGTWPVKDFPATFSQTPAYIGGPVNRSGPSYGEDNEYVYGELLGLSPAAIADLRRDGVI